MESTLKVYAGRLAHGYNGEERDLLSFEHSDNLILADSISDDLNKFGRFVTLRLWISEKELSEEERMNAPVFMACGLGHAKYVVHYSEYTGYLWTDEELNVGGHDLLAELKSYVGLWLYLELEFSQAKKA